jgi:hypothetical protein
MLSLLNWGSLGVSAGSTRKRNSQHRPIEVLLSINRKTEQSAGGDSGSI